MESYFRMTEEALAIAAPMNIPIIPSEVIVAARFSLEQTKSNSVTTHLE